MEVKNKDWIQQNTEGKKYNTASEHRQLPGEPRSRGAHGAGPGRSAWERRDPGSICNELAVGQAASAAWTSPWCPLPLRPSLAALLESPAGARLGPGKPRGRQWWQNRVRNVTIISSCPQDPFSDTIHRLWVSWCCWRPHPPLGERWPPRERWGKVLGPEFPGNQHGETGLARESRNLITHTSHFRRGNSSLVPHSRRIHFTF